MLLKTESTVENTAVLLIYNLYICAYSLLHNSSVRTIKKELLIFTFAFLRIQLFTIQTPEYLT